MARAQLQTLLAAAVCSTSTLLSYEAAAEEDFVWGGIGYTAVGTIVGHPGSLGNELVTTLGPGAKPGGFFPTFGGGGWMLIGDRFLVGGRGFGVWLPDVSAERGSATIHGGGGGFDLAYAVVSEPDWLAFPFVGVGACGLDLTIQNDALQPIAFGTNEDILPGQSRSYRGGFYYLEMGFSAQRLLMWGGGEQGGQGGFALGGEVGLLVSSFNSRWGDEEDYAVNGVDAVRINGGFLRLTVGGGGFYMKE